MQDALNQAEYAVKCIFCRIPNASVLFEAPAEDLLDPEAAAIVAGARLLRQKGVVATPELLSTAAKVPMERVLDLAAEVTPQMRMDFRDTAVLIRTSALQRRAVVALTEWHRSVVMANPIDIEDALARMKAELAILSQPVTRRVATSLPDIIDELELEDVPLVAIPTGIPIIDAVLRGGSRIHQMHLLAAAMKQGKTLTLRNIGRNVWRAVIPTLVDGVSTTRRVRAIHIALDGGDRKAHACDYIAMEAKELCLRNKIDTLVHHNGVTLESLTGENIRSFFVAEKKGWEWLSVPMRSAVIEMVYLAIKKLKMLREEGYFRIFDVESMGYDLGVIMSTLERCVLEDGIDLFLFDHLGEAGDKARMKIFERFDIFAQLLGEFIGTYEVSAFLLSQRNKRGISKHGRSVQDEEDDSYDPELEGGVAFLKKCDSCWIAMKPDDDHIKYRLALARRAPQMAVTTDKMPVHGATGLILPRAA